jgi:hypothetical protein
MLLTKRVISLVVVLPILGVSRRSKLPSLAFPSSVYPMSILYCPEAERIEELVPRPGFQSISADLARGASTGEWFLSRDKRHSTAEALLKLAFMGSNPGVNFSCPSAWVKKSHAFLYLSAIRVWPCNGMARKRIQKSGVSKERDFLRASSFEFSQPSLEFLNPES